MIVITTSAQAASLRLTEHERRVNLFGICVYRRSEGWNISRTNTSTHDRPGVKIWVLGIPIYRLYCL